MLEMRSVFVFLINVRCNLIYYDPPLDRPFHKDFNGVSLILGGCIPDNPSEFLENIDPTPPPPPLDIQRS